MEADGSLSQEAFRQLAALLHAFFEAKDNVRKQQIEQELLQFKVQENAWKQAVFLLQNTDDQLVLWFSASVFEHVLSHRWNTISPNDQAQLRNFLFQYFLSKYKSLPSFVSTKVATVLVLFAKMDWPTNYPDFLQNLLTLTQNPETTIIGLQLLKLTSEEFSSTKEDLPADRKNELKTLLTNNLQPILDQLSQLLERAIQIISIGSPAKSRPTELDPQTNALCQVVFETLLQLFSWIPLDRFLSSRLIDLICQFVMFNEEISILAFSCINEILSKNYVPRQLEEFLLQIFLKIFTLLDRVTQNSDIISQLDERFVNKLTQFTLLFVSNHFHRVETNPNFPIIGFLTLLYKYTFMQTSPETLQSCLEIWEAFLDYTIAQKNKEGAVLDAKSLFHSYQTGLLALSDQLSKTIQYRHNAALLDQMDDSSESEESEKESFLKICLDIIARVADLYPMTVLEHSYAAVIAQCEEFTRGQFLAGAIENNLPLVHFLKDFTINLRLIGRLAEFFLSDFAATATASQALIDKLLEIQLYAITNSLFERGPLLTELQAQIFGTLRTSSYWLIQFQTYRHEDFVRIINLSLDAIISTFAKGTAPKALALSAADFLKSLAVTVKPTNLASTPQICTLIQNVSTIQSQATEAQFAQLMGSLTSRLLATQTADFLQVAAQEHVVNTIDQTLQILSAITSSLNNETKQTKQLVFGVIECILSPALSLFTIYLHKSQAVQSTGFGFGRIRMQIQQHVLQLFLALLETFTSQISEAFLGQTITTFLDSLGGSELSRILSPPVNDEQVSVLRTLFEILLLIVKRPTPTSSKSTPSPLVINIVGFCLDQVLPQMRQGEQEQEFVTVTPPFYDLLYFSLLNHFDRLGVRANEVLAAFARSLEMVDITLFKQNLNHLEQLNTKINLYSRWPYLDHLMATLFKVLLSKTHDLLRDEIILALHHMASVTWEGFFSHTLPGVVGLLLPPQFKEPLLRGFTTATDSPTFSLNTNRLINDANYYAVNATNAQRIGP